MGADMLLATLPAAEITEHRQRRLHEIIHGLSAEVLASGDTEDAEDDPENIRETLNHHIELFANAGESREVAKRHLPHMPYAMLFTGGLSWGDGPTEMFDTFAALAGIEPVFVQLEIWAREDAGAAPRTLDREISAIAVLNEFVSDVRAAFGTEQEDSIDEERLDRPRCHLPQGRGCTVSVRSWRFFPRGVRLMPHYDVHIYAIARVKVSRVETDSPQEAVHKAEQGVDLHHLVASGQAEYADEIEGFLVDVLNEAGQRMEGQSVFFDPKNEKPERE